jgi:nucleoside-triphosphatase THEP1
MKILLTGKPKSGKTTLLLKLIDQVKDSRGFAAKEVRENDIRIGFSLVDSSGRTAPLASTSKKTSYPLGRYYADVESLDEFIKPLFSFKPNELLYIDEIGQMQLHSSKFKKLVAKYLQAGNHFLGTITCVYEDKFVASIQTRQDILTCEITPENRNELEQGLGFAVEHRDLIAVLAPVIQTALIEMGTRYLRDDDLVRFKKLFKNAVPYIAQGKIERKDGGYLVKGNTNDHHVKVESDGAMSCDCDLFHGRGKFAGQAGQCSHIQTALLLELAKSGQTQA